MDPTEGGRSVGADKFHRAGQVYRENEWRVTYPKGCIGVPFCLTKRVDETDQRAKRPSGGGGRCRARMDGAHPHDILLMECFTQRVPLLRNDRVCRASQRTSEAFTYSWSRTRAESMWGLVGTGSPPVLVARAFGKF